MLTYIPGAGVRPFVFSRVFDDRATQVTVMVTVIAIETVMVMAVLVDATIVVVKQLIMISVARKSCRQHTGFCCAH